MDKRLFIQAMTKFLGGVVLVGLLLFLSAGSLRYWQAWQLIGILFVPMLLAGLVMMGRNPDLLRKRLDAREKESEQKTVVFKRAAVHCILCRCRIELAFQMVGIAELDRMGGCRTVSAFLSALC